MRVDRRGGGGFHKIVTSSILSNLATVSTVNINSTDADQLPIDAGVRCTFCAAACVLELLHCVCRSVRVRGQICIERVVSLGFCCPQQLGRGRGGSFFLSPALQKKDLSVGGDGDDG